MKSLSKRNRCGGKTEASALNSRASLTDRLGERANNFDFIRFVLACAVVVTHSYCVLPNVHRWEPLHWLTRGQLTLGVVAVNFFFFISGFLIIQSWHRSRTVADFVWKRFLRIYPAFVLALISTVIVGGVFAVAWDRYYTDSRTYSFVLRQLLFHGDPCLYGTFASSNTPDLPLGSLATLRYEVGCYCLFPLLAFSRLLRYRHALLSVVIALLAAHVWWPSGWTFHVPFIGGVSYLPRVLFYFLLGTWFFQAREHIRLSNRGAVWATAGLLACTAGNLAALGLATFGCYLLMHAAFARNASLGKFGRFGDFSYGIFIYGYLIQQGIVELTRATIGPVALTILSLPLSVLVATASWYGVERRFLRLKVKTVPLPNLEGRPKGLYEPTGVAWLSARARATE